MTALPATAVPDAWDGPRRTIVPLLVGLVLLGWVFRTEAAAAAAVWRSSTTYNHCILVLPIALWLAYERRARLPATPVRPLPGAALLVLPLGGLWLLSERLGIMEGRQFAALGSVEALALAVLGWRMVRAMAAALLYLLFLVPFGAFLTAPLQDFTVHFVVAGLGVLGIPNFSDGHVIEIPEGVFFVAEACAGLRFLIASVAFGALYALTLYRGRRRRVAFVAAAVVVPVVANGVRALGIVAGGHWVGSAEAAAADHIIYGWLFFSVVLLLLMLAGLPFRQDGAREVIVSAAGPPPATGAMALRRLVAPAVTVALLASASPLLAADLDRMAAAEAVAAPAAPAGCVATPGPNLDPDGQAMLAAAAAAARSFLCDGGAVRLLAVALPPRTNPMLILAVQRHLTGQDAAEDVEIAPLAAAPLAANWQDVRTTAPDRRSATALWLDGAPAQGGVRDRLRQARNSILGARHPAILLVADAGAPAALAGFAARQPAHPP